MKRKPTTASTGLPDCVLAKALELKAQGFKSVSKARVRFDGQAITFRDERLTLEDLEADLAESETWGLVYFDGERERKVFFPPLLVGLEATLKVGPGQATRKRYWLSNDSEGWIHNQIRFLRAAGQQVKATFTTKAGKEVSKVANRKALETSSEWKSRKKRKGATLEAVAGAHDAEAACDRLEGALGELIESGEMITPVIWKALESAFQAGECSGRHHLTKTRMEAAQGRPMTEKRHRKGTRKEWTAEALAFLKQNPKAKGREVAEHLKEKWLVDFDRWGDELEFSDETSKSKAAFEAALTPLRKKV